MKKNWFFIILLSIAALSLAGTAAYFSVFGLTKLFAAAGLGITILAASLEFAKLVTVSYVYRYWKYIKKSLRGFYIFAVVFIMFLTSVGIFGFLTGAYQQSENKLEKRDSQIKIVENKKNLFVAQLERVNNSIKSSDDRINTLSGLRTQQEKRLDNLYNQKYVSVAKRAEAQISGSDDQIKIMNADITDKMKQTNVLNDSISFYDQKIVELKSSDVSNEIGPYKFIAQLTGVAMNKIVSIVALLIVLVFDPLAVTLLIGVNQLTMLGEKKEETDETEPVKDETESVKDETESVKDETEPVKDETEPVKDEEIVEEKIDSKSQDDIWLDIYDEWLQEKDKYEKETKDKYNENINDSILFDNYEEEKYEEKKTDDSEEIKYFLNDKNEEFINIIKSSSEPDKKEDDSITRISHINSRTDNGTLLH
jgi:hypothetical protein